MTEVTVILRNNHFYSIECEGHTGYAAEGEDIVCAALSSIVQTALLGMIGVVGINVDYIKNDDKGFLSFALPHDIKGNSKLLAEAIGDTMVLGIQDLYEQFSDFIELEVIKNVY